MRAHAVVTGGEPVTGQQVERHRDREVGEGGLLSEQGHGRRDGAREGPEQDDRRDRLSRRRRLRRRGDAPILRPLQQRGSHEARAEWRWLEDWRREPEPAGCPPRRSLARLGLPA